MADPVQNDAPSATITPGGSATVRHGGEILVNSAVAGNQSGPQITTLANGGFVVTWSDNSQGVGGATGDASSSAVKAQLFAPGGARIGDEILVNTAVADAQTSPEIAALANGGFVITWTDYSQGIGGATGDTSNSAVKAQVFAADGTRIGDEILVNTEVAYYQDYQQITALSNGGFVVTFKGGDHQVKARIFEADGTPIGDEFLVNTATFGFQEFPQITSLSNGGFVVTWEDNTYGVGGATGDDSGSAVKAQIFTADGTPVGGEILVNTAIANDQQEPLITALSNGGFVVTWWDNSQGVGGATGDSSGLAIKAQVFAADGMRVGGEILVNTSTANTQISDRVTALSNGGFVVTWSDISPSGGDTFQSSVKAQVFGGDGARVGGEILVNTAVAFSQDYPEISALASGGFVVTWSDSSEGVGGAGGDNSGYAIKAQVYSATGAPVGGEILVNTATADSQIVSKVSSLPNGGFVVTWNDDSQGVGGATGDTSGSAVKAQVFAPTFVATEQVPLNLKGTLAVADPDAGGAVVETILSVGFGLLHLEPGTSGASVDGNDSASVTITGTLAQINALLGSDPASVVNYIANSDTPPATTTLTLTVDDGGNSGDGGALTGSASDIIDIAAVNDGPVTTAPAATQNGIEDTDLVFSAAAGNPITVADPDAGANLTVTLTVLNGRVTLASTAGLTGLSGNGTASMSFTGTPAAINAALDGLIYRGNLNYEGSDTLTIATTDNGASGTGGTLTDTDHVAIVLADDGYIDGDAGDNVLTGTPGPDFFRLQQGGDDDVDGAGGNDVFLFGAALTSADKVNGNAGVDQLAIQGDYPNLVLGTGVVSIESLALLPASDSRFGGGSASPYDYAVTTVDENVAAGARLSVDANRLGAEEDFTFDGSAETDGSFFIFGGGGDDDLTGGARNDVFLFGAEGQWGAGDAVDGGAGLDQLVLRGDYAIEFGAGQLAGIESIALVSAHDTRFGALGLNFDYDLTMDDGNVAAGAQMVVDGTNLRSSERLMFDGNAEQDGSFRVYGGAGDDRIHGGAGDDLLAGGGGKDYLIGGAGADTHLVRSVAESTGTGYDTLGDFIYTSDTIDLPGTHDSYQSLVGGTVNSASFDADMTAAMEGVLDPFEAVIFSVFGGDQSDRVFLIVDQNGIAGYQSGEDFVFEIQGAAPPQGPVYPDFIV